MEDEATSKAGLKDEGLMLDFDPLIKLTPLLAKLQRSRVAAPHLWTFTAMDFRRLFAKCAEGAGLRRQALNPYQFRPGSASQNVLTGKHTIEEIQARLRHEAPSRDLPLLVCAPQLVEQRLAPQLVERIRAPQLVERIVAQQLGERILAQQLVERILARMSGSFVAG